MVSTFKSFPFVLDGFPRTGSTTLMRVLNVHPDIKCCMEPFHPQRYGGEFNRLAVEDGTVATALDLISLRWNGLKHVWQPDSAWPFVARPNLNDDLIRRAAIIVSLRRRNLLRQFVSAYICKHIGFWVGTSAEFNARLNTSYLPPIDLSVAKASLAAARDAVVRRDELLSQLSPASFILTYEEMFEKVQTSDEQLAFCNSLFSRLGHRPLEDEGLLAQCLDYLNPAQYRWASNDVYARIPGSTLLDTTLGNDTTGYLFS